MNKHDISKPIHLGFTEAFKSEYNEELEPSICVTSGEPFADKICYILNEPVKTKYSLIYNVDNRPTIMDEARVSYRAIRTTNEVKEDLLNPIGKDILNEIKNGK